MAVRDSYSIKSDRARGSAPGIVKLLVVIYFWGLIGFALGTLILLGPVRWWAGLCRERGFSDGFESGGVVTLILLLVMISFSLSLWAATEWVRSRSFLMRLALPALALGVGYYAYSYWMNPSSLQANMANEQVASKQFTFGPFPDEGRLRSLKKEGYTAVISLLHPAVVPFEPQLIEQERKAAEAAGIEMIHLPMLPWVSDNKESLEELRKIAASRKGRYYIHCYLGEDRVNVARRVIETEIGEEFTSGSDTRKQIGSLSSFERGKIYPLDKDVYLTPYPTDEELSSFFLGGQIATVIALLEPDDDEESKLIAKERALYSKFAIDYVVVPIGSGSYDPSVILAAVGKAKSARKPVVVHAFFPPSHRHGSISQAFLQAYVSGKPPVPTQFFENPLRGGKASVVAPNIVTGPVPEAGEWTTIYGRGVRSVVFAGGSDVPDADRMAAEGAGLEVSAKADVDGIVEMLARDGPFYVCGPSAAAVIDAAASRYGPPVPSVRRSGS